MKIEYDEGKRAATLAARGLDMARTVEIFAGPHLTIPDQRFDYGEARFLTIGLLAGRMMVLAWTPRGDATRIISLRKANEREEKRYFGRLGRSGRNP